MGTSLKLSSFIICSVLAAKTYGDLEFDYKEKGTNWPKSFPECGSENQSPIDITNTVYVVEKKVRLTINKTNGDATSKTIRNTGHSIIGEYVPPDQAQNVVVSYQSHTDGIKILKLYRTLFHWGQKDGQGSEHAINGTKYDAEMRHVFYPEKYDSLDDALKDSPRDVMIMVFLLKITDEDTAFMKNSAQYIDKVREIGSSVVVPAEDDIRLDVVQKYMYKVYAYYGSLSVPPCTVGVQYVISKKITQVPKSAVEALRKVKLSNGDTENLRALQPSTGILVRDISIEV